MRRGTRRLYPLAVIVSCGLGGLPSRASGAAYVWWEGEKPAETNLPHENIASAGRMPSVEKERLSAGAWLSCNTDGSRAPYFVKYKVTVPRTATYNFWVRKFWHHGPFRWRFDDEPWRTCNKSIGLSDSVVLRLHVCANWKALGEVELEEGTHTLRIELLKEKGPGCLDCFLLIPGPFSPRGKLKPDVKYNRTRPGWFPFEPDLETFREAALDLRSLNEKEAGSRGFLRAKGMDFVFEKDGKPVKFWAINVGPNTVSADKASARFLARRLAKYGVNMVRVHSAVCDRSAKDPTAIDRPYLDKLHYFQAALKKEGIYVHLSFYYVLWFQVKPEFGLPGYENIDNKKAFGLLPFHPRMQQIYKSWARVLLTTKNPYTGLSFAQDPAVGIVEIQNEDNYFFWTFTPHKNISPECMAVLEKDYGDWLVRKYGSLRRAARAWGPGGWKPKGDDFARGRAGLYDAGVLTNHDWAVKGRNQKRARDQVRFLTEHLRKFHADMVSYFRGDLGVKCVITATNWRTADERTLGALDKYTNMPCDAMDRHGYSLGRKISPRGWQLNKNDLYQDNTALLSPDRLPIQELQYTAFPHIISEINWNMPNRFRAESPVLIAAYASLQGTDGPFFFAVDGADWMTQHARVCLVHCPAVMGQFPATALMYRRGYVKEGPVVVHEALRLSDLYDLKGAAMSGPFNVDRQDEADPRVKVDKLDAVDPLAYYVGQVTRTVAEDPGKSMVWDFSRHVDRAKKVVRSATGELTWDYGVGLVSVNAPAAQGATGFLDKAGRMDLSDVVIESPIEYGSILVVSMDGKPLASSGKMLLQVMTEAENYGWKTSMVQHRDKKTGKTYTMKRIDDMGGPPILVKKFGGTVRLKRPDAAGLRVTTLDLNGYGRKELTGGAARIDLLPDCLYYVIEK